MDDPTGSKLCSCCKTRKPLSEYGRDKQKRDGLTSRCKACRSVDQRRYAQTAAGRDSQRRRQADYRVRHPERAADAVRKWREANPGYSADSNRRWREAKPTGRAIYYAANKAKVAAYNHAWAAANLDRRAQAMRRWRAANPGLSSLRAREWQIANPEKAREIAHRRRARKRAAVVGRIDLDLLWQRQCAICPLCDSLIDGALRYPHSMSRSIDHVLPLAKGGSHAQANLQWTHLVCNLRKGATAPD